VAAYTVRTNIKREEKRQESCLYEATWTQLLQPIRSADL